MIDIESEVYTTIARVLRKKCEDINISSEFDRTVLTLPKVTIDEKDNTVYQRTQDSGSVENHSRHMFEVNVYTNTKSQARKIMGYIDDTMAGMGFTRTFFSPIPNLADATIYRLTARYSAVIDTEKFITYRG